MSWDYEGEKSRALQNIAKYNKLKLEAYLVSKIHEAELQNLDMINTDEPYYKEERKKLKNAYIEDLQKILGRM